MDRSRIEVRRSEAGHLQCRRGGEGRFVDVRLRPCFPLTKPGKFVALHDIEGECEMALVESLEELDEESRRVVEAGLADSSFLMEVTRVESITDGPALREWRVETAQGPRRFLTQLDLWPRRLESGGILIQDVSEDLYLVRDVEALDARSRAELWSYVD